MKNGFFCYAKFGIVTLLEAFFWKYQYQMKHEEITEKIIKAFYKVCNTLGYGFLEKVYENAMFIELTAMRFKVEKQKRILVYYFGSVVGDYNADLVVEGMITVELKANEILVEENENQLINYLKATNIQV